MLPKKEMKEKNKGGTYMDYINYLRNMVGHEKVIMVSAGVIVFDRENRILLQKRTDNGYWGHPGGFMELGETIQDTARREVFEETGLELGKLEFFDIHSGLNTKEHFQMAIKFPCSKFCSLVMNLKENY